MTSRVLAVDDDPRILYTIMQILSSAGIGVDTVESGKSCLACLEQGFSGLILLDIMMPNMDGWDTIREIFARGYTERVMVVMLTAKDTPDEKMDGLQEFVFDYITKPFYPDELIERVMKYLTYI